MRKISWFSKWHKSCLAAIGCLAIWTQAQAYTVVTISTGAPTGLESSFLAATTNQFQSSLFVNPLAANTYELKLFGLNPNWNPPTPAPTTLEAALSLGATVYVYGFANGMTYQNHIAINMATAMEQLCGNATNFNLIQATTATFNTATCQDVINCLLKEFYQVDLSTPTPLPPVAM